MERDKFAAEATVEGNSKWDAATHREHDLYKREDEIRSPFARDFTRILHCTAYRRLKHKTQVFFATTHDHVCTRIEHVNHVNSVSKTIALFLGLNSELTDAISLGHDLGHAPFGHMGEMVLESHTKRLVPEFSFWHEKNSLRFVDHIETLEGPEGKYINLDLTYAVRDGMICHCGEVNQNGITPRPNNFNLNEIQRANEVQPYTWEGCVVKISDKIAYLGRDIEDAMTLGILEAGQVDAVDGILRKYGVKDSLKLNNTVLIHSFIIDLCKNSDPSEGIKLSEPMFGLMKEIMDFCKAYIYRHPKIERYKAFVKHILDNLFEVLVFVADDISGGKTDFEKYCPTLYSDFKSYLTKYAIQFTADDKYSAIQKIYDLTKNEDRHLACIDFISGMTDQYAIKKFKETITF